ncbi:MAG: zinc-dependent alcohol dehydrogenase family protein [Geminicoccaceae bacterium]
MQLEASGQPLRLAERAIPEPGPREVLVRVAACGVCRTDLHVVDGDLPQRRSPIVPGHEIVGRVERLGPGVAGLEPGQRVGIPWLGHSCGRCRFCAGGRENLCDYPGFTGWTRDGGYADYAVADAAYCFPIPDAYDDVAAAPLLCAGLIGYRTLRLAGDARRLGIYGFGAAAHIVAQIARHQGRRLFAFTRPGDTPAQRFARSLGAEWAGSSYERPPEPLDAALVFAPVGDLVPAALRAVDKGGIVVLGGIHMSDVPSFPYRLLWEERVVRSVANLTRDDGHELLALAPQVPVRTETVAYPLEQANAALDDLRHGRLQGAVVLVTGALPVAGTSGAP